MKSAWKILGSLMLLYMLGLLLLRPAEQSTITVAQRSQTGGVLLSENKLNSEGETGPVVSQPVTPHISRAITTAPKFEPDFFLDREINPRLNLYGELDPNFRVDGKKDPLLSVQANAPRARESGFLTPILNFEGQGFTFVNPPDTVGDVGPDHYIQMINAGAGSVLQVYDKAGALLAGPITLDSLGSGQCANGAGDPIVLYDRLADRWVLSEFSSNGNRLCLYVSQTPNPVTTNWYHYEFTAPSFPDYPKYGVWPDAYYVSSNESGGPAVYALDRNQMLTGAAATSQRFSPPGLAGFGFQALTPTDLDGATPPPAGSPNYFMRHRDDEAHNSGSNDPAQDFLEIWEFDVDFANPANSSFTGPTNIAIAEINSDLCGFTSFFCFPMPGSSTTLDPLREVVMWRLQYRNFGSHETLVGNLVTDVDNTDHGGIRWFELRKTGSSAWTLFQEGTFAPDDEHRFMGSIAMDGGGNIALAYSVTSSTVYPSIRYAGRRANDPSGTLPQSEGTLIAGSASNNSNRWGDYSSMNVDPADDCTFWYTNVYSPSGNWSTRIGTFKFDECSGASDFTLSATPESQEICAPTDALYTIDVGQIGDYADSVTLSATGHPAGTTANFSVSPVTPPGESVLTIGNTGAASAGSYDIEIMGIAPTSTHTTTVSLDLLTDLPTAAPTLISPADGATDVSTIPTLSWNAVANASMYEIQIASDAAFSDIVDSGSVANSSYTPSSSLASTTTYYWRVRAMNSCGAGSYSTGFSFTTQSTPPILLVDDDSDSGSVVDSYTAALDALNQSYDLFDTAANGNNDPTASQLAPYETIIWFTGEDFGSNAGPNTSGEAALSTYLDNNPGSCLFLSSQDYLYAQGGSGSDTPTSFMSDYLGMSAGTSDQEQTTVTGAGDFGGLGPYSLNYPFTNYSDQISPDNTAASTFTGNAGNAAISKVAGDYRTTWWGFPFEAIPSASERQEAMGAVLAWCGNSNGESPQIAVNPASLASTQGLNQQNTESVVISNQGAADLTWTIQEDEQRSVPEIESTDEPSKQMSPEEQIAKRQALQEAFLADRQPAQDLDAMPATPCLGGTAGSYSCNNVDLLAFMPLGDIGGGEGNDIWGWTDPETGKEYAIMGRTNGTAFVDISDPENPVYLGNLPGINSLWGDIKVYSNHAFIVSEASGHGMQIFDLTELRDVSNPPLTFSNTAHYGDFGNAHNIVINEESGFAYAVGTGTCSAGLHMVNIQNPTSPTNAGCFSSDGYTHDAQCVMYNGPDTTHQGQEICFNSNEDTLTIVDVSNKNSPAQLSRTGYAGSGYTHQGWLTEDHSYFLLDDETDEQSSGHNTRTYIWDVSDLDSPSLIGTYNATTAAIDHNLYIKGQHAYQSNYRAGLRILELSDISNANLTEAAYFDIYPNSDTPNFNGTWSNYPYFESGVVIVSGIEQGLFILQPNLDGSPPPPPPAEPCDAPSDISWASVSPTSGTTAAGGSNSVDVTFDSTGLPMGTYTGTLCINSNDPVTSLLPVPLTLTVSDSSQTIKLNQGWNKIGLSVEPTSPIMAESLCAEIGNIVEINRWQAGGWDGHICGQPFNNFTLEINKGYFIHSNAVATWNLEGLPINSPTLDLQIGWNSISLPHTDGYTAESLCDEIIDQGVTAIEINRWYAGGWDGHICNQTFNDFPINRGEGYFIKSTTAGPVTPPAVAGASPGQQPSEGVPQFGQAMPIHDLVVGNLRDTSVTLSWTTEEATTGYVRIGEGNPSTSSGHRREGLPLQEAVALDIRGASTSSRTHVVLLDDLAPETTYQLEVVSGADGTQTAQITVTTARTLQSIPSSDTIYGQAFQADGVTPAAGALVHLTLKDADGAGSSGEAKLLSALVDEEGYWHANLGNARTNDLLTSFNYTQGDQLLIKAQGADGRTATETVEIADDTQAPDITLASIPTAVEIATYHAAPARTPSQAGALLVTFLLAVAGWWHRKK